MAPVTSILTTTANSTHSASAVNTMTSSQSRRLATNVPPQYSPISIELLMVHVDLIGILLEYVGKSRLQRRMSP
ncbi:MAG: hypothetical protein F4X44_12685 [Gammaproteobacteria bacterium]|nr:hypothetical protein [Gammaproteobacteria bacterium]